eukprot:gene8082-407_t
MLKKMPPAGVVAPGSLWVNSTDQEFDSEMYHLGRVQNTTHHDCFRVQKQFEDYVTRRYLPQARPAALDSGWLLLRRSPCVERLMCAWFNEFVTFSHREQLSFFFAVDMLGLRSEVHIVDVGWWNRFARNRWRHNKVVKANGACLEVPTAQGPLCRLMPGRGVRCRHRCDRSE